jgi:hypothetical protein
MTTVEFLESEITEIMSYLEEDGAYAMQGVKEKLFGEKNIIQQAKEMEKEQIKDAFNFGVYDGGGIIKKYKMSGEQYYNETFKSE